MHVDSVRDAAVWDTLTPAAPLSQSWAYGAAAEALGARVHRFAVCEGCDARVGVVGAVQILERRLGPVRVFYAPGGVFGGADSRVALQEILARQAGIAVCVAPAPSGLRLGTTAQIALCDPAAPRPKRWRNAVARAQRQGLYLMDHGGCPDWLWRGQVQLARARHYVGLPRRWLTALEHAVPGTVRSIGAYRDGLPVAGITVLRHGARWTYQIGWSDASGRSAGAHNLLLDVVLRRAQDAGVRVLDLGLAPADNPGLRRFKLSCGAQLIPAQTVRLIMRGRGQGDARIPSKAMAAR